MILFAFEVMTLSVAMIT